jgi:quinol-cytochrome oxidoreductase complex cytochrome b subunit
VDTEVDLEGLQGRRLTEVVLSVALASELCLLVLTGVLLFFVYRPTRPGVVELPELVRVVHRLVSWDVLPTSVAYLATALGATWRRARRIFAAASLVLGCLGASFTGFLLPWDQVALWAVRVGPDVGGFRSVFLDATRFFLIDSVEVGVDTMQRWLTVHVVLGAALTGIAVAIGIGTARRSGGRPRPSPPMPSLR